MGNQRNKRVKKAREQKQVVAEEEMEEIAEDVDVPMEEVEPNTEAVVDEHNEDEEQGEEQNKETYEEEYEADVVSRQMPEEDAEAFSDEVPTQTGSVTESQRKRRRGATKMKHIARDPHERHHVDFTALGEPCGPGSVALSSYLGPLVREHVPVTIDNWKKVGEDIRLVLWKSIEMRFDLDEEFKKAAVFKQMGCLWRASKSRLVSSVRQASNIRDRMDLRPKNVSTSEWRKFVREKTSTAFKVVSDSYRERREKQIPHTSGRKGMVRLREDLLKTSEDPSEVSRLRVWVKSRTKKDGTPVNVKAAEKIRKAAEIELEGLDSSTTNPKQDGLTQILGPDNPGRLRAMGRGISMTKLTCLQVRNSFMAAMEQKHVSLEKQVFDLQQAIARMNKPGEEPDVSENSNNRSVNTRALPKCYLVDWCDVDVNVAEGRIVSSDADELVNGIPLGPNAVKVLVETVTKPDTFLWRPAHNMFTLADAEGEMIAWHADHCIFPTASFNPQDNNAPKSPSTSANNICKLLDYIQNEEVVAVGRWETIEPKAMVNGLPLGPNAIKVYVDSVVNPKAYIWRPTVGKTTMEDYLNCYVAWPATSVQFDSRTPYSPASERPSSKSVSSTSRNRNSPLRAAASTKKPAASSKDMYTAEESPLTPPAPTKKPAASLKKNSPLPPASPLRRSERNKIKQNQKIKLLDLSGNKVIVAEGRWSSNNPEHLVHFEPLGPGACRVFVDVVKVKDAAVWRTTSEIEYMEDALGTCLAWPEDKIATE